MANVVASSPAGELIKKYNQCYMLINNYYI